MPILNRQWHPKPVRGQDGEFTISLFMWWIHRLNLQRKTRGTVTVLSAHRIFGSYRSRVNLPCALHSESFSSAATNSDSQASLLPADFVRPLSNFSKKNQKIKKKFLKKLEKVQNLFLLAAFLQFTWTEPKWATCFSKKQDSRDFCLCEFFISIFRWVRKFGAFFRGISWNWCPWLQKTLFLWIKENHFLLKLKSILRKNIFGVLDKIREIYRLYSVDFK